MRKLYLLSSVLFVAPFMVVNVQAADCVTQNCPTLGYTENSDKGGCLKCPFGNYWACACDASYKYTCTEANEVKPWLVPCNEKYELCDCISGYEWNSTSGKCEKELRETLGQCTGYAKNCSVGQILNNDGTCTDDKVIGKTPIGVVVYISGGSDKCGYAMTASPIQTFIIWSSEFVNTGVFQSQNWEDAIKDFDVSGNMTKIIQAANGDSSKYPAAYAALNYAPSAAPATKGKWMLPTAGILNSLYTNLNAINNAISKVGGTQLKGDNDHIWSSSEAGTGFAWYFCTGGHGGVGVGPSGGVNFNGKNNTHYFNARSVIAF